MSVARSVAKNAIFKGAGEAVIRLLSFAFVVLVARTLSEADFGYLNFAYSFPLLFVILVDFGFNPLLIREASRAPERAGKLFTNLLRLKAAFALFYVAAVGIGLQLVRVSPAAREAAYWLAAFTLFNSFTEMAGAAFQSRGKMQVEAAILTGQKLALLGFGLLALAWRQGLPGVAAAYAAAGAAGAALGAWALQREGLLKGPWAVDGSLVRSALRQALPLTLTTLFINVYFRIDMTLLATLRPAAEAGWYGAAHKCIEVAMVLPAVLVAAAFPDLSRLFVSDPERLRAASRTLFRWLIVAAVPVAAGTPWVAAPLMRLVFGPRFAPAGPALAWLAVTLGMIFLTYLLAYLLICADRQKFNAGAAGAAVGVSVLANLLLIPRFGHVGAAAASAATEGFLLAAYGFAVRRWLFSLNAWGAFARAASAGAVMTLVLAVGRQAGLFVLIPLAAAAYGGAAWWFRAFTREDLARLHNLLPRRAHA